MAKFVLLVVCFGTLEDAAKERFISEMNQCGFYKFSNQPNVWMKEFDHPGLTREMAHEWTKANVSAAHTKAKLSVQIDVLVEYGEERPVGLVIG